MVYRRTDSTHVYPVRHRLQRLEIDGELTTLDRVTGNRPVRESEVLSATNRFLDRAPTTQSYILASKLVPYIHPNVNTFYNSTIFYYYNRSGMGGEWERNGSGMGAARYMMGR